MRGFQNVPGLVGVTNEATGGSSLVFGETEILKELLMQWFRGVAFHSFNGVGAAGSRRR